MSVRISSVEGNRQWLDGGAMFGNAPRPVWEKWIQPDSLGRIPLACRAILVEIGATKILCEAGIGSFFEPKLADRFGVENYGQHKLLENLAALGVQPQDISYVILSHLHFDHAGGLLPTFEQMQAGEKGLVFSKAKFVVGKEAWQRALSPHSRDRASFVPELNSRLQNSGRLIVVEGKTLADFGDQIEFIYTSGHTPGQMHTLIRGESRSLFYSGDLIPGQAWVHVPITMGYDRFPEQLIDEKKAIYARGTKENWWFAYTHDAKFVCSHVIDDNGSYRPSDSKTNLVRMEI